MPNGGFLDYETPEYEQTEKRYKLSVWWVNNRALLKKIGLIIWAAIDAVLILFALWVIVDTYLISYESERALSFGFGINQETRRQVNEYSAPEPVIVSSDVSVFSTGDGRYDFYGTIENTNDDYWMEFTYHFAYSGGQTDAQVGYVYPLEQKPVIELAYESESRPTSATLVIEDYDWNFIDPHEIADFDAWRAERIDFDVTDSEYTTALDLEDVVGRSTFTILNDSAYSYWEPEFYVLLYRGGSVVAVTKTAIPEFMAGETRTIDQNWFGSISSVTKVEAVPEIQLFDSSVYMSPPSQ